jgi:hypothetical protein
VGGSTRVTSHIVIAAANGTDKLSSSRTGIVSTSAATSAAAIGAPTMNQKGTAIATFGCVHQHRTIPAIAPVRANAIVPAQVFSRFHGNRELPKDRPASVAMPSPTARMAHAAAAISRRDRKKRMSSSTANG